MQWYLPNDTPTLVLFGARGDLVNRKLLWALYVCFRKTRRSYVNCRPPFRVIGTDRTGTCERPFSECVDHAGKKYIPEAQRSGVEWPEFLKLFSFHHNDLSEQGSRLFNEIKQAAVENPRGKIIFYLAVPYQANFSIVEQLHPLLRNEEWAENVHFIFEKPMETDPERVKEIERLLTRSGVHGDKIGVVEHFARKPGVARFRNSVYGNSMARKIFDDSLISKIELVVHEQVGSEARNYPGILVDSVLNHGSFLLSLILGNPSDNEYKSLGMTSGQRLSACLFSPEKYSDPSDRMAAEKRFHEQLDLRGRYGFCSDDLAESGIATAVRFKFNLISNRWGKGNIPIVYEHAKNTPHKSTYIRYFIKDYDDRLLYRKFILHEVNPELGIHVHGEEWSEPHVSQDSGHRRIVVKKELEQISDDQLDGYPSVMNSLLGLGSEDNVPDHSRLLNPFFQEMSNRYWSPAEVSLQKAGVNGGVIYKRGTLPFYGVNDDTLIPVYH